MKQELLKNIQQKFIELHFDLCYNKYTIDDSLMRKMFKDNISLTEFVLRMIIGRDDLKVKKVFTQSDLLRLTDARALSMDIFAALAKKLTELGKLGDITRAASDSVYRDKLISQFVIYKTGIDI